MDALDDPTSRFAILVAEHQAVLRTFVRMLGVQPIWVDDVAQEILLIAYRRFDEFDQDGDFFAWVRGIARKVVANHRRKVGRQTKFELASFDEPASAGSAHEALSLKEVHAALRTCLENLSGHSRDLVRMRYEEDLDSDAMGAGLGREGNAVRQSLFRVREVLRRCIDGRLGKEAWP
jgi:RNA polymerase sigma-70 factor, ECF subfamily